jgi:hypothetical protein
MYAELCLARFLMEKSDGHGKRSFNAVAEEDGRGRERPGPYLL